MILKKPNGIDLATDAVLSEIEIEQSETIEHFPADVYFENGRMTFIFDNAMLSMEVDNTKLEELKALIKCQRKQL